MARSLSFVVALALAVVVTTGCKHTDEAAKQTGADLAARNLQAPIERARAAATAVEANAPALLDADAQVYHKPGCRFANPATMEMLTVRQADARGAKPDPACFPAP